MWRVVGIAGLVFEPYGNAPGKGNFINKSFSQIKFIVLSVHDEPVAAIDCLEAGSAAFVLKRRAVDDLIPAVEAVLRGETYVSSGMQNHSTA